MINSIDHLIVCVNDLEEAEENYIKLFGFNPVFRGEHIDLGTKNSIFNFKNTYLELLSSSGSGLGATFVNEALKKHGEGLAGMALNVSNVMDCLNYLRKNNYFVNEPITGTGVNVDNSLTRKWKSLFLPPELSRGLFLFLIEHTEGLLELADTFKDSSINKLDHIVINTNDGDGFIKVYRDVFKIRLALDKVIEHWKKRILFFRTNNTTIEVIESNSSEVKSDNFWGLAWATKSIEESHKRLTDEGIEITPIKEGLKENTLVATLKSHTNNVPTLLIEHLN